MKPLSVRQKEFIYSKLVFGKLRWIMGPVYSLLIGSELTFHRIVDMFCARDKADLNDLTVVIKTFERPCVVRRLIGSIRRRYPDVAVIVVDDSKSPQPIPGVKYITMPYDSGLSAGRNRALDELKTPYFLLLDDDFVFSRLQKLGDYMKIMRNNPEVDILGGRCIDLPLYIRHKYEFSGLFQRNGEPKAPLGSMIDGCEVVEKVQNYFVGRTEPIRNLKWKTELKLSEHTEFFSRAYGVLTTVLHPDMFILHAKTPFDMDYMRMRHRRNVRKQSRT